MPYFTFYGGTSTNASWISSDYTAQEEMQQQYEEHIRQCAYQDRINEQRMREAEERAEDRRRYPLFFLKDGIV